MGLAGAAAASSVTGSANATVTLVPVLEAAATSFGCTSPPGKGGPGKCKYAAFRIPGFVNSGGTLQVFAEGRATGCGDFSGYHDMVTRRSTVNEGKTWGGYSRRRRARTPGKGFTATHGLAVCACGTHAALRRHHKGRASPSGTLPRSTITPLETPSSSTAAPKSHHCE